MRPAFRSPSRLARGRILMGKESPKYTPLSIPATTCDRQRRKDQGHRHESGSEDVHHYTGYPAAFAPKK